MSMGNLVITPEIARERAAEMKSLADELRNLLDVVSKEIDKIDNVDTGIYQGNGRPAEIKAELDQFRSHFSLAYAQIEKSADNIVEIANSVETY